MKYCQDCGDECLRRKRCPHCNLLVCSHCWYHTHINMLRQDSQKLKLYIWYYDVAVSDYDPPRTGIVLAESEGQARDMLGQELGYHPPGLDEAPEIHELDKPIALYTI